MKTLQEQYNLIKEGKGNKQQFFKSARHLFPDLITPVNSFNDAVNILKNRGVISEMFVGGGVVTKGRTPDWFSIFNENMDSLNELERTQMGMYLMFNKKTGKLENYMESPDHKENNTLKKQIEDQGSYVLHFITGNDYNKFKDNLNKFKGKTKQELDLSTNNLKEAKEAKAEEKETTKEVTDMATRGYDYKDTKNIDNIFGTAFLKGFYSEMQDPKNEGKTVEELKQIVAKNMAKDCLHYVKNSPFGVEGGYTVEAPGLGEPKPAKGKHKSSGYGDLKESVMYGDSDGDRDFDMKKEIEANEYYDKGLEAYAAGDLLKAEKYYQAALKAGSWLGWTEQDLPPYEKMTKNPFESLQESVLRSQIHLLVKEVLAESKISEKDFNKALKMVNAGKSIKSVAEKLKIDQKQLETQIKNYKEDQENLETSDKG